MARDKQSRKETSKAGRECQDKNAFRGMPMFGGRSRITKEDEN